MGEQLLFFNRNGSDFIDAFVTNIITRLLIAVDCHCFYEDFRKKPI